MLAPNTILQNRYRVVRKLGQGGMGAIYEAIDQRVSCLVALKETLVGSANEARSAFQREAALLANLSHPALPKVMDYFGEGDGEFLVMEFIPGHDLAELLALRDGPFPQRQVLRWGIELLKLLEYLHTLEPPILHRDIKPANLKATKQGELFLLDFGLAKGAAGQMVTLETDRSVAGYTPVYAPLEQILGQGTDQRSDLYSLGAALYHVLTGQIPVSAPKRFDAIENNRPDPLKPANQLNPQVAPEVVLCLEKSMALSRKDRFSTAAEMRIAMEHAAKLVDDRDTARRAEAALVETLPSVPDDDPDRPRVADKDVQFTVYAPQKIKPEKNYTVLAFAHLSKRRGDAAEDEPDPIAEMKKQAARVLGQQQSDYRDVKEPSSKPVPHGGELTFVPVVKGLTFNPPSRNFNWRKSIHREEFDVQAGIDVDGQTLNGSMTVFLGSLVIAEVSLTISVDSSATSEAERIPVSEPHSARRVKQVFASYSQKDEQIVSELAHVAPLFGSRFLMDRTHLEPGEDRIEGLQRLIREADVFQLFWSTNSMRSSDTAGEIKYAASLGRPGFILPTYWEDPVPRSPAEGLPPPEIERLQFYRIHPGAISQATVVPTAETRLVIHGPSGAEIYIDDERHGSIGSSGRVILKSVSTGQHVLRVTRADSGHDERVIEVGAGEQIIEAQMKSAQTGALGSPIKSPEVEFSAAESTKAMPKSAPITASPERPRYEMPTGELISPPMTMAAPSASASVVYDRSPAGVVVCVTCRMQYSSDMKFCADCGGTLVAVQVLEAPAHASVAAAPPSPSPPAMQNYQVPFAAKSSRRGWMVPIYAGAAMVLFVAIVAPILFVTMNTSRTASNRPPLTSSAPSTNTNSTANVNRDVVPPLDVQFASLTGEMIRLKDYRGRVVLLNIWTARSPISKAQPLVLNDLQEDLATRGLSVIGLSKDDTVDQIREFQKQNPQNYPICLDDGKFETQFPASTLPTTYLIDRHGRIRKKLTGVQSRENFEEALEPLLNEAP